MCTLACEYLLTHNPKMAMKSTRITQCRSCGRSALTPIISLGSHALSSFVTRRSKVPVFPLSLVLCDPIQKGCGLVQMAHRSVPSDMLYRAYWYRSGVNQSMSSALSNIVSSSMKRIHINSGDFVVDIGANDGTLLSYYPNYVRKIAVEPAKNLIHRTRQHADAVINDYFSASSVLSVTKGKKVKIISTIAMFYDLEDPNSFVSDVSTLLTHNGIWVNQMASLAAMIEHTMFDNICHEHLEHFSLAALETLYARHHLSIVDIETNDVNGGSFRVYAMHEKQAPFYRFRGAKTRLGHYRALEKNLKLTKGVTYRTFARKIASTNRKVMSYLRNAKKKGETIYGYGASTKGNTLLQYFGLNTTIITAIAERNPDKWNHYTAGTHIPIVSEEDARIAKPDIFLVLPWHFRKEFLKRETKYLAGGGIFLFPLPNPELVYRLHGKTVTRSL